MGTLVTTIVSVVVAIGLAVGLFVGANALVDETTRRWPVAVSGLAGVIGVVVGTAVQHNGWLKFGGDLGGPLQNGWLTIVLGGVVGAAVGYAIGTVRQPDLATRQRSESRWRPVVFVGPAVAFVALGLALPSLKTLIISFRDGSRGEGGFSLANYGDIFGDESFFNIESFDRIFTSRLFIVGLAAVIIAGVAAYASTQQLLGTGEARRASLVMRALGVVGLVVLGLVLAGIAEAIARDPNESWIYDTILTPVVQSRVTLWLLVAVFAGGCAVYLARNRKVAAGELAEAGGARVVPVAVTLGVLAAIVLGSTGTTSGAETVSLILVAIGLGVLWAVLRTDRRADELDLGAPTASLAMVIAAIVLALALFSSLESVLWNNLWWVATVTGVSTVLGLMLAMLADRSRGEGSARTLIFLPMAISMVGAAVIWDFMYELQASGNQTGLVNAILQGTGFVPRGFFVNSSMIPWNNFWIMLIMVWIQTGFAMVILSASIKGVPDELIEAARVDGATEVQVFWRVIMPQIRTTIVVVITTLIIIVMKVFDLVKATTGGANRTNVLANEMFNQLRDRNFSLSSAFAVVIFALVLPVMIYNVRSNLKEVG